MARVRKLGWVEFGRGCAAFIVFVSHGFYADVPSQYGYSFLWGNWGVCFFFVLSGFIITLVHSNEWGNPSRLRYFWRRRFLRIFPTYWLALLAFIFVRNALGNTDYKIDLTGIGLLENATLWSNPKNLILPVAWTLRHELLFYAIFSIAILNKKLGWLVFSGWFLLLFCNLFQQTPCEMLTLASDRCMSANANLPEKNPTWFLVSANYNLYFFIGMLLAKAMHKNMTLATVAVSLALSVALYAADAITPSIYVLAIYQASMITFLVALAILLSQTVTAPPPAFWLGNISYAFYLFHAQMMLVAHGILKRIPIEMPWQAKFIFAFMISCAAATAVNRLFERPLQARFKSAVAPVQAAASRV